MTIIDVFDSAIKIGLGATIGGGFSWILAKSRNKHEVNIRSIDNKLEMLKQLSIKIEEIDTLNAHAAMNFHNNEIGKSIESVIKATEAANIACAYANVLGKDELVSTLSDKAKALENMYKELRYEQCDESKLFAHSVKLEQLKKQAYPHIRSLYSEISS